MRSLDLDALLARASLAQGAMAVSQALLDRDFDEGRFRAHLVVCDASTAGLTTVGAAARCVLYLLGPAGSVARLGIGLALLRLSEAIEAA